MSRSSRLAVAAALALVACSTPHDEVARSPDVLLISIDTLRADRLGCYGYAAAETPFIDSLAASGVAFDHALSPVPLTLPAHASLFSGTIPPVHGVRLNGGKRLDDEAETLAERMRRHGYCTAAFIAADPLHRRGGLDQGFERYEDDLPAGEEAARPRAELYAEEVLDRAARWLDDADPQRSVFAFIHLFDPHWPYEKSLPGGVPGYDGEVAWVDAQLGRFFSALEDAPRWERALRVITSDHGEGLGQHGESSHGLLVYQSTLHVPLIVTWPGRLEPRRVEAPVGLIDVAPTLIDLAGAGEIAGIDGVSLVPLIHGETVPARDLYFESLYGYVEFGWAALRGLRGGDLKLIAGPSPELYDLRADPQETSDRIGARPDVAERLDARLQGIDWGRREQEDVDPERLERLSGLGYVSARPAVAADPARRPDPRAKLDVFQQYMEAVAMSESGSHAEAEAAFEPLRAEFETSPRFFVTWGDTASKLERWDEAARRYERALELDGGAVTALHHLGVARLKLRQPREALVALDRLLQLEPDHPDARYLAGSTLLWALGEIDAGVDHWRRFIAAAPDDPRARSLRAVVVAWEGGTRERDALRRVFTAAAAETVR